LIRQIKKNRRRRERKTASGRDRREEDAV